MRRLFAILSALSLALLVVTGVLWVRSYFGSQSVGLICRLTASDRQDMYSVRSCLGSIHFNLAWRQFAPGHNQEIINHDHELEGFPDRWTAVPGAYGFSEKWAEIPGYRESMKAYYGATRFHFSRSDEQFAWPVPPLLLRCRSWDVVIPHWVFALLFGCCPGWWLNRRCTHARRALSGVCTFCGYDLRVTPERCRECGTNVDKKAQK